MKHEVSKVRERYTIAAVLLMLLVHAVAETTASELYLDPTVIESHLRPKIDGYLDDEIWQTITPISNFHQTRPDDRAPVTEKTEAFVARDQEFIYVAFKLYDSQIENLSAKGLIQGQPFFSDDRVAVSFDTFNDKRNSYFFQVNPNGVRRDALVGNDYFIDDWSAVWFSAARVHKWGWTAELSIPLKSIAFDPLQETWGLNFARVSPGRGEEMAWSSLDRNTTPSAFGELRNMTQLSQGRGLQVTPSVSVGYRDSDQLGTKQIFEPSITSFYNITPNLSAGLTVNTDFSGTEADQRQINLSRFSLFFPEKRDFFLRDASIFEFGGLGTNARPFFSRRIGLSEDGGPLDLETGLKLSGRVGAWNVGALLIQQDTLLEDADDQLFVGRVTRNILSESEFGIITTSGDPNTGSNNRLNGADFTYRNSNVLGDQQVRANLWYQQTDSQGVFGDQSAYGARLSYPNYNYDGFIDIRRIEENFNPALGFVNRRGVDQVNSRLRRRFRQADGYFDWLGARAQYFRSEHIGGGIQTERKQINPIEGFSSGNDYFTLFLLDQTEGIKQSFTLPGNLEVPTGEYNFKRYGVFFETGPQREVSAEFLYANGDFYQGKREVIELELNWRPNKYIFASLAAENNQIEMDGQSFTSELYSARANIALNSKWAWLNLIQGDNVSDTVSVNSRIRYQPQADREFFLIFNQTVDQSQGEQDDYSLIFKASFNYQL